MLLQKTATLSMSVKDKQDKTSMTRKGMLSPHTLNEGSFPRENALKNSKFSSYGITTEFLCSYLYGKKNIKPVDRKQLLEETAAKRVFEGNNYRRRKIEQSLPYAFTSFPNEVQLCQSSIPGSSYGVCTKKCIPRDTWIGPYEGRQITLNDITPDMDTSFLWEIYENGKLVYYINGSDESSSSWMRFIRCARHEQEQNLCAIQYKGNIFYRAFRDIPAGEEMLVWYDKNYNQHMGIPIGLHEKFSINLSDSRQHHKQLLEKDATNMIPRQFVENVKLTLKTPSPERLTQMPVDVKSIQHHNSLVLKSGARPYFEGVSSTLPKHHFSEWFQPVKENIISGQQTSDPERNDGAFQRISQTRMLEGQQYPHSNTSNLTGLNRGVKRTNLVLQGNSSLDDCQGSSTRKSRLQSIDFSPNKALRQTYAEGINGPNTHHYNLNMDRCNRGKPETSSPTTDLYSPSKSVSSLSSSSHDLNTPIGSPLVDICSSRKQEVSPPRGRYSSGKLHFNFDEIPVSPTETCSPTKPLASPDLPVTAQSRNSPAKPLASPDLPVTAQFRYSPAKPLASPELPVTAQSRNSPTSHQGSPASPDLPVTPQSRYSPTDEIHEWKCGQCHKTFTQRVLLQNHVCPRQPEKPYKCGHCAETFANSSDLRIHVVKHTSEKPFKCGFCSRAFAGATTLNNHIRTHTGEKPFGCEKCGCSFSQASQLARHLRLPGECMADRTSLT